MGTASRKTWLEKQTEEVRKEILAMDDGAMTLEQMVAALKDLYGIVVAVSTLGASLKAYRESMHLSWAADWGEELEKQVEQNPHLQVSKLARNFVTQKVASSAFSGGPMKAEDAVAFAQAERRMDLQERRTAAVEERNRLKKEEIELDARRVDMLERKLPAVAADVAKEADAAAKSGKPFDEKEVLRKISAVIGVGGQPEERIESADYADCADKTEPEKH